MSNGRTLVGTLGALPIVVAAVVLVGLETARELDGRSELFARPAAASIADALDRGDLLQAHALISREPGALLWVSHPDLTGGTSTLVSPLLWAVATGNEDAVRMLLGLEPGTPRGFDRHAVCLAGALGRTRIVELLEAFGRQSTEPCPALDGGRPPLLELVKPGG